MKVLQNNSLHAKGSNPAMSKPRAACGPLEAFVQPSLGFRCSKGILDSLLTTYLYFDNLEFDILDAGGRQCHFITSFTIAVKIRTVPVH